MEQRAPTRPPPSTLADYFAAELSSAVRHEFRNGRIIAMAGGSPAHTRIASNVNGALWMLLRNSPCRASNSELRVYSAHREIGYCYPDATVVCGPDEYEPLSLAAGLPTIINPRLVVEVLSESTEADDRGEKFDGYRELPTFEQYVLVAQDQAYVLTYTRQPGGGWLMMPYIGLDAVVPLSSIGVDLPMGEVYANITFPPSRDPLQT